MAGALKRWNGSEWVTVSGLTLFMEGAAYTPSVWNDEGVYSYFYIDFKEAMDPFSNGMLTSSLIILASNVIIPITAFEYVSTGIYKIFADITNQKRGVIVMNRRSSFLYFASGKQVPPFSERFFVAGLDQYDYLRYIYQPVNYGVELPSMVTAEPSMSLLTMIPVIASESLDFEPNLPTTVTAIPTLTLI